MDGKEADALIGTSHNFFFRKCPCCLQTCSNAFILPSDMQPMYRNDNQHELVSRRSWEVLSDRMRVSALHNMLEVNEGQRKRTVYTEAQKKAYARANNLGIVGGLNTVYQQHYYLHAAGIGGFHKSNEPDNLHVIDIGLLKRGNEAIISIILDVSRIDLLNYGSSSSLLDLNIQYIPIHCSYSPVRVHKFSDGITGHIQQDKSLGLVEGNKQLPLLLQLMFSIGEYGNLLPDKDSWMILKGGEEYRIIANVTEVVLSYCASMIEAVKMVDAELLGFEELKTLRYLLSNATYHWLRLIQLAEVLANTKTVTKNVWKLGRLY